MRRLKNSSIEKIVQDRIYDDFCGQLQPENLTAWIAQAVTWEKDPSLPSPYHIPSDGRHCEFLMITFQLGLTYQYTGMTEAEVKAQLLEDEETGQLDGEVTRGTQVTATTVLIAMFDMEEQQ